MKLLKNIFLFLFVTILFSCSNVFENLNETDFIVSLDLSELVNNQNKTLARNASKNVGKLTLTLYNALDNSIEQAKEAISKEVLPVVSSVAVDINTEGTTKVSFLKIPIGINAVIFAECSIPNADNSNVLYEGYSQVFEVTSGKNSVKIDLSKIVTEANPEDNVTEDNEKSDEEKTDEENTDEENTDEEGDQVQEDTKDPEEVVVEPFTLVGKGSDGAENGIAVNTGDNTFKVTIPEGVDPSDVWQYYVEAMPTTNPSGYTFEDGYNYKLSVELKSDELNVIGIAAANTDMFFTVGTDWTTCEFTIGALNETLTKPVTIGTALSKTTEIRNLKIEKLERDSSTKLMPSISIMIANSGIEAYKTEYKDKPNPPKIVDFSVINNGYRFVFNSAGVTLQMRDLDFTDDSTGLNKVSFDITSTNQDLETSLYATTNNPKIHTWNGIKTPLNTTAKTNLNVLFPIYAEDSNYTLGILSESNETASIDITDLKVETVNEENVNTNVINNGMAFIIKVGDVFYRCDNRTTTFILDGSEQSCDVLLAVPTDAYGNRILETDNIPFSGEFGWTNCIRFAPEKKDYGSFNVNVVGDANNKPQYFTIQGSKGKTIKLSLTEDFTVLIEEVMDTNNDQPAGGEMGLLYDSTNPSSGKLRIYSEQGLKLYRDIVNGTLTQDLNIPYMYGTSIHPISKNQTYALEALLERNITVSEWVPIGTLEHPFTASFDGQGHSITINSMFSDAGEYAGVFGYVQGYSAPKTISNLVVKGAIQSSSDGYVGGIVAYAQGVIVENCVNMAELNSGKYVGGIIGFVGGGTASSSNKVSKCINAGLIRSTTEVNNYSGGIVAHTTQIMTISDCINLIDLTSSGIGNICGIVDVENTNFSPTVSVNNCINVGNISVSTPYAIASTKATINNCYYDSDKWTGGNTPNDNITPKTTELLTNGEILDSSFGDNWSFAEGRYPLPDLSRVFESSSVEGSIWSQICAAAQI